MMILETLGIMLAVLTIGIAAIGLIHLFSDSAEDRSDRRLEDWQESRRAADRLKEKGKRK